MRYNRLNDKLKKYRMIGNKSIRPRPLLQEILLRSWWVILFFLICLAFYEFGRKQRSEFLKDFRGKVEEFRAEKQKALSLYQDLLLKINSQSDPAFVELTLMKVLGVVPEGQTKIYFYKKETKDNKNPKSDLP